MVRDLTEAVVDATVHTPDGDRLGSVAHVDEGVAYVEPAADAPETVLATLGWDATTENGDGGDGRGSDGGGGDHGADDYPLPRTAIDSVAEDGEAITLRRGDAEADRSADNEHDADLARAANEEGTEASEETRKRTQEQEAEQEVEESVEREAAARESSNPDAHRDEEPFDS
jgi:hypothetical protein